MKLLIAEDDPDISKALCTLLKHHNYCVDVVDNGDDAYAYAAAASYDGIILDIMMPGMDGMEVLRRLRSEHNTVPVLLLTAKGEVEDRVSGLDAGADDYLPKPFAVNEFLARVRAMLRRRESFQAEILRFAGLALNLATFELSYGNRKIRLASREFQVMELLMQAPGTILPAERFMEHIWGWDSDVEVNIVWVYISNLRKKLASLGAFVEIRAVRGVGYCLEEKGEQR